MVLADEGTDGGVADADASNGSEGRGVLWLSAAMVASLAAAFVYMAATGEAAGYGRHSALTQLGQQRKQQHRWLVGARLAWCLQELPALLWPLLLGTDRGALVWRRTPNFILWCLFLFHYSNRALVYPFRICNGKPTEFHIMLAALLFCMANGYMQARSLCHLIDYGEAWTFKPQFLMGVALMVLGWCMNFHSDGILRSLRRQKQSATVPTGDATGSSGRKQLQDQPTAQQQQHNKRYRVPRGGAFDLLRISCPNYAGEVLEWVGFMVACDFSAASSAFAFATAANLVPRAISHHEWYITNLNGYPRDRTAVVPLLL